jgi:hypothetical protein
MDGRTSSTSVAQEIIMNRFKFNPNFLFVFIFVFGILLSQIACEPEAKITFINQQDGEINIQATHVREDGTIDGFSPKGVVSARTEKTIYITFLGNKWVNRIKVVNSAGEIVFSHDYTMSDLEKIAWKITIQQ